MLYFLKHDYGLKFIWTCEISSDYKLWGKIFFQVYSFNMIFLWIVLSVYSKKCLTLFKQVIIFFAFGYFFDFCFQSIRILPHCAQRKFSDTSYFIKKHFTWKLTYGQFTVWPTHLTWILSTKTNSQNNKYLNIIESV